MWLRRFGSYAEPRSIVLAPRLRPHLKYFDLQALKPTSARKKWRALAVQRHAYSYSTDGLKHQRLHTSQQLDKSRNEEQSIVAKETASPQVLNEVYKRPTTGFISYLPESWIPYAELARIDKPTGTYYLFFPCLFSTFLAASMTSPVIQPLSVLTTSTLFFAGAFIMRGAGCTVNDLWDRKLDPHVERTKFRPIARGAVTPLQATTFLGSQLLLGLGILLQFPPACLYYGIPSLLLVALYPSAKRITHYPQVILGFTFSWGAIMGFPALGIDLVSNTDALVAAAALYGSCIAWTVNYDMIYAHMDIKDDAKIGIKSIARAHEHNTKAVLQGLSLVQVGLLGLAGFYSGATTFAFWLAGLPATALSLNAILTRVDLKDPQSCLLWFQRGAWIVGGVITLGFCSNYLSAEARDRADRERNELTDDGGADFQVLAPPATGRARLQDR